MFFQNGPPLLSLQQNLISITTSSEHELLNIVLLKIFYYYTQLYMCSRQIYNPTSQFFPHNHFLYVNLGAKGAQKLFKTLARQLTVLGIPHFCWCIQSHIASYRLKQCKANTQRIVLVFFLGQWNASTSLKNCPSAIAYFPDLLRLSSPPPLTMPVEVTIVQGNCSLLLRSFTLIWLIYSRFFCYLYFTCITFLLFSN